MFKKFNWGHGIFVFYVCFVGAVLTALIASFSVDHSLVVDDYYAEDIAFQSQYDKTENNLKAQSVKIDNDKNSQELTIDIESNNRVEGSAEFYRPSDKSQDFNVKLKDSETKVSTKGLVPGKWILKIDWTEGGKSFYKEEVLYI